MSACGHCDCADGDATKTATKQTCQSGKTTTSTTEKTEKTVAQTKPAVRRSRVSARRGRGRGRGAGQRRRGARNRIPADILENTDLKKAIAAVNSTQYIFICWNRQNTLPIVTTG